MGTLTHTHTRSHLYTLVPTPFSQIKHALRAVNFYSGGIPIKEGQCAHLCKNKRKREKENKKFKENKEEKKR